MVPQCLQPHLVLDFLQGILHDSHKTTLRTLLSSLETAYTGDIGYEYMHINEYVAAQGSIAQPP